jgi:glyoxylase-like metal-dependent hydrolase (beta-lactamase superfamily II)
MNQKMKFLIFLFALLNYFSCAVTSHTAQKTDRGLKINRTELSIKPNEKGIIEFQKIIAVTDWAVDREGLINLNDPKSKAAGLKSGDEPTEIYFYVIDHPKFGTYIIDTGISEVFKKDKKEWPVSSIVAGEMHFEKMKILQTSLNWSKTRESKLSGIFLTHIHLDHILGTIDFPEETPIFMGPKETINRGFLNLFVQDSTDSLLGKKPNLQELNFSGNSDSPGVLDFFGDGSFYAIWSPGHTDGSMAFLIKTTKGLELVLGDTCHTRWGWENDVTPGSFTSDQIKNRKSLDYLQNLAKSQPGIGIHPGHQR